MPVDSLDDRFPTTPSQGATMRNRKGFTLIELLIVVVIIGILAAIALPKFGQTRERAYVSAMQSDLRNVQTVQELYWDMNDYTYFGEPTTIKWTDAAPADFDFVPSSGVTMELAAQAAGDNAPAGYSAVTSHEATGITCSVIVGTANPQGILCSDQVAAGEGGGG
jgi:type IV pilus assembly protein PilA